MTQTSWLLLYAVSCSAALLAIRSLRLSADPVTPYELKRRVATGDAEALALEQRIRFLPRLVALRRVVEVLLVVGIGSSMAFAYGWFVGGFWAAVVIVTLDALSARAIVGRWVWPLYRRYEPTLIRWVSGWRWLDVLKVAAPTTDNLAIGSKAELADLIARSSGVLSSDERRHMQKTLEFNDSTVGDIMTPRSMIDSIDVGEVIGPLVLDQLHKTGHSRIPVVQGDIDHIVGMLYVRDLVSIDKAKRHTTIKQAMRDEVFYIHQDKHLEHALHAFLRTHHHLCVVVNEFRETVGLLSLEDVIEALLGRQVVDEFDAFEDLRQVAASNPRANNRPHSHTDL